MPPLKIPMSVTRPILDTAPMSESDRKEWLISESMSLAERFRTKYQDGAKEHGGDLGEVPFDQLLNHLEMELVDGLAYIRELRRRFK